MTSSTDNRWLHWFAILTAAATFCLIWVGGLVTSHGAGMAVPDWPTTYGYNMFFFPMSKWVGGIFYEHSHRLVASGVGLLTVVLAVWLWVKENRNWLRWLGVVAVVLVVAQGILGGLRVTHMKDALGVFHGTLAQMFFVLVTSIALFTSRWWRESEPEKLPVYDSQRFRYLFGIVTGLILLQLILGAAMRHQHAGLAIPDFPMAYGKVWPDMDASAVARYNQARGETTALNFITSFQVGLQMAHRIGAVLILTSVAWLAAAVRKVRRAGIVLNRLSMLWLGLILLQASLGAATIWTNKAADIATAHVAVGALSLMTGAMLALVAGRREVVVKAVPPARSLDTSFERPPASPVRVSA